MYVLGLVHLLPGPNLSLLIGHVAPSRLARLNVVHFGGRHRLEIIVNGFQVWRRLS